MKAMNIQFRINTKSKEVFAVVGKYKDGKCLCYSLDDNHHFECYKEFLLKKSKPIHWSNADEYKKIFQKRYDSEIIHVGSFRYVTTID